MIQVIQYKSESIKNTALNLILRLHTFWYINFFSDECFKLHFFSAHHFSRKVLITTYLQKHTIYSTHKYKVYLHNMWIIRNLDIHMYTNIYIYIMWTVTIRWQYATCTRKQALTTLNTSTLYYPTKCIVNITQSNDFHYLSPSFQLNYMESLSDQTCFKFLNSNCNGKHPLATEST